MGEEFDGHVVSFASCGGNVDMMAAIVLAGWAEVPAVNAVRRECTSGSGRFIRHHAASRGSKWCFVEVEVSVQVRIRRQFRIHARRTKKIQSEFGLKQEAVPFSDGEIRIASCQTS